MVQLRTFLVILIIFVAGCASQSVEPDLDLPNQDIDMRSDVLSEIEEGDRITITIEITNYANEPIDVRCRVDDPFTENKDISKTQSINVDANARGKCVIDIIATNTVPRTEYIITGYVQINNGTEREVEDEELVALTPTPTQTDAPNTPSPQTTSSTLTSAPVPNESNPTDEAINWTVAVSTFVIFSGICVIVFIPITVVIYRYRDEREDEDIEEIPTTLFIKVCFAAFGFGVAFALIDSGRDLFRGINIVGFIVGLVSPGLIWIITVLFIIIIISIGLKLEDIVLALKLEDIRSLTQYLFSSSENNSRDNDSKE
jgi:uncharacterized ubiquitin-like protein YukD